MIIFLQVHVDKGMNDGQKLTFRGEGDQEVQYMKSFVYSVSRQLKCFTLRKNYARSVQ